MGFIWTKITNVVMKRQDGVARVDLGKSKATALKRVSADKAYVELSATAVVALLEQADVLDGCTVAVDGTVFECYPYFKERMEGGIQQLLGTRRRQRCRSRPSNVRLHSQRQAVAAIRQAGAKGPRRVAAGKAAEAKAMAAAAAAVAQALAMGPQ